MLSWVVCWLHGHVVCDGSLMVGKLGGGWLGDHTSMTIVPALTQCNAFQSRGGWGVVPLWWTSVTLSGSW